MEIKKKLDNILKYLDLEAIVFLATENDIFRKPKTTIIDKYLKNINKKKSFYCGDGAGRERTKNYKRDFSDTDYKFAYNLEIKFYSPEEFFLEEVREKRINYPVNFKKIQEGKYTDFKPLEDKVNEVVITCGFPGSGKSYFTKKYIEPKGFFYINQDTLKSKTKVLKVFKESLKNKIKIVIDNTNLTIESREELIKLSKEANFKIRCLYFTANDDLSKHNSHFRNINSNNKIKPIKNVVYNVFKKKFTKPTLKEGFDDIQTVDFVLEDIENKELYYQMMF